jgi:hypothetical protein
VSDTYRKSASNLCGVTGRKLQPRGMRNRLFKGGVIAGAAIFLLLFLVRIANLPLVMLESVPFGTIGEALNATVDVSKLIPILDYNFEMQKLPQILQLSLCFGTNFLIKGSPFFEYRAGSKNNPRTFNARNTLKHADNVLNQFFARPHLWVIGGKRQQCQVPFYKQIFRGVRPVFFNWTLARGFEPIWTRMSVISCTWTYAR